MTEISRVTDHVEQGLGLLLDQYRGKPRIEKWTASYLKEIQVLEDAIYDVIVKRLIDNATGEQLNVIGRIVGEPRRDRNDETYRYFIRIRIRINRSQGKLQDVFDVLALIAPELAWFDEFYPAAMMLEMREEPALDPEEIHRLIKETKAGGVGFYLLVPTAPLETRFVWGDTNGSLGTGNGFGDASALTTDYGLLSDAVTTPR